MTTEFGKEQSKHVGINRAACEQEFAGICSHGQLDGETHCVVGQSVNSMSKILNKGVSVGGFVCSSGFPKEGGIGMVIRMRFQLTLHSELKTRT